MPSVRPSVTLPPPVSTPSVNLGSLSHPVIVFHWNPITALLQVSHSTVPLNVAERLEMLLTGRVVMVISFVVNVPVR